jgi:hypothetical protein
MDNPYLLLIVAIIGSGALGALVTELFRSKHTAADAMQKSAESLNLTYDQMMEAIKDASSIRKEMNAVEHRLRRTIRDQYAMKIIARKLYQIMERRHIATDLTHDEIELILQTQDLVELAKEQEERRKG